MIPLGCGRRAGTTLDPPRKPEDTIESQQRSSEIFPTETPLVLLLLLLDEEHPIVVGVVCKVIVVVAMMEKIRERESRYYDVVVIKKA